MPSHSAAPLYRAFKAVMLVSLFSGCIHRQTDLEWARSTGAVIDTSSTTIRGKSLEELELMVEPYGIRRWRYPMDSDHLMGSPFGMRTHPILGSQKMHRGQDIPCHRFEPIYAVARGEVVLSKRSKTAGKYIEIAHETDGKEVVTRYMHMSIRRVREGRSVRKGKKIGRCGSTGLSTGPHLHFEVQVDGKSVAPFSYVERSARRD